MGLAHVGKVTPGGLGLRQAWAQPCKIKNRF